MSQDFQERYHREWLIERRGHRSPEETFHDRLEIPSPER